MKLDIVLTTLFLTSSLASFKKSVRPQENIAERNPDSQNFIRPQLKFADLIIRNLIQIHHPGTPS